MTNLYPVQMISLAFIAIGCGCPSRKIGDWCDGFDKTARQSPGPSSNRKVNREPFATLRIAWVDSWQFRIWC